MREDNLKSNAVYELLMATSNAVFFKLDKDSIIMSINKYLHEVIFIVDFIPSTNITACLQLYKSMLESTSSGEGFDCYLHYLRTH